MNDDKQQKSDQKELTMKEMLEWRRERQKRVELCLEDEFYDILDADDYYPEPKSESVKTDDKKNTSSSEAL